MWAWVRAGEEVRALGRVEVVSVDDGIVRVVGVACRQPVGGVSAGGVVLVAVHHIPMGTVRGIPPGRGTQNKVRFRLWGHSVAWRNRRAPGTSQGGSTTQLQHQTHTHTHPTLETYKRPEYAAPSGTCLSPLAPVDETNTITHKHTLTPSHTHILKHLDWHMLSYNRHTYRTESFTLTRSQTQFYNIT